MYKINAFLQKRKMSESQYGIYMVAVAYILSFALLFLGSDTFYKISTRAAEANNGTLEETQEDINNLQPMQYRPYNLEEADALDTQTIEAANISGWSHQVSLPGDSYWLLGQAMNTEEYNVFIRELYSNTITSQNEVSETDKALTEDISAVESNAISDEIAAVATAAIEEHAIDSLSVDSTSLVYNLTSKEIEMLERIVEAEATGEDMKGKMLVANVVFNRMNSDDFPDSVEDVIFQETGGDYQFSPIEDKRFWKVKITKETKEAVQRVLEGEDHSKGALYFMSRKRTKSSSAKWFDNNLKWLFKHGGHEFYKNK